MAIENVTFSTRPTDTPFVAGIPSIQVLKPLVMEEQNAGPADPDVQPVIDVLDEEETPTGCKPSWCGPLCC